MLSNIPVLFEDAYLLVLDKPTGLIVDNTESRNEAIKTVENYLIEYRAKSGLTAPIDRSGIVHRLDKETSGVLLVAKDSDTLVALQDQFRGRLIDKEYKAVVSGEITQNSFSVDAPIGRNPRSKIKYCVIAGGRAAVTDFEKVKSVVIEDYPYTLLKVVPHTGRTHQIRVHLLAFGTPVAGDDIYQNIKAFTRDRKLFGRMMLHAEKIAFTHPKTGAKLSFEAKLPVVFDL